MGQPRAKTGAKLRPNRANIGQQQTTPNNNHNNNNTSSGCRVYFCRRPAVRRKPHKSGQGPPGRGIAEGVSLLSVGERGRAPCRRPTPPPRTIKNPRVLRCFVLFPFFAIFRSLWLQDGSTSANIGLKMGQHSPQDGATWPPRWANIAPRWANIAPRWANIAPRWANIAPRWANIALKMGPHSPKIGRRPSKYPAFYSVFFAVPIFRIFWLNMGQHEANIGQHSHKMGPHCPQDRPTYANIGQHSHTMGLHSWAPGRLSRVSA